MQPADPVLAGANTIQPFSPLRMRIGISWNRKTNSTGSGRQDAVLEELEALLQDAAGAFWTVGRQPLVNDEGANGLACSRSECAEMLLCAQLDGKPGV